MGEFKEMISILIASEYPVVRKGLKLILDEQSDIKVVSAINWDRNVLKLVHHLNPDIIIMDMNTKNLRLNIIHKIQEIVKLNKEVKIIVLNMQEKVKNIIKLFIAGADGYLSSEQGIDELVMAIRTVYKGHIYLNPIEIKHLIDNYISDIKSGIIIPG